MGEFSLGEAVKMGDQGIQFGADGGTLGRVGYAVLVALEADGWPRRTQAISWARALVPCTRNAEGSVNV